MMAVLMLTLFFAAVLTVQVPPLIKSKHVREMLTYSLMMLIGMIYSYAYVLDIELPNPTNAIDAIFRPLTQLLDKVLG